MDKIIISPSKYVQGEQVLTSIAHYVKTLGERPLVIADEFVTNLVGDDVKQSFADEKLPLTMNIFGGECSRVEIERITDICATQKHDVIVGIGGGKTLDTAKAVAFYTKIPVVVVPTIASTDAPTSALAVIYTPEGEFAEYLMILKTQTWSSWIHQSSPKPLFAYWYRGWVTRFPPTLKPEPT